jgi:hypothetical protein
MGNDKIMIAHGALSLEPNPTVFMVALGSGKILY